MNELTEFMESPCRNEWLRLDHMSVYVRKGHHAFDGQLVKTIDIANISVDEDWQNSKVFTRFLEQAEVIGIPIHIENVLTTRFANFFRKREGYDVVTDHLGMVSFLKIPSEHCE